MKLNSLKKKMVDRDYRFRLQMVAVPLLLALLSLAMSAMDYFRGERTMAVVGTVFGVLSAIFALVRYYVRKGVCLANFIYLIFLLAISGYLIVSGAGSGIGALWILLFPAFGLMMFGHKQGFICCGVLFAALVFLMWTPYGSSFLRFDYNDEFLLRFPLIFCGFSIISLLFVLMRELTYDALVDSQKALLEISVRDGMTGVCNHAKFTQDLDELVREKTAGSVGFIYVDINGLKSVNDHQSHDAGDHMIYSCVSILKKHFAATDCYRVGGDEFVVLLRDIPQKEFYTRLEELRADYDGSDDVSVAVGAEYTESIEDADKAVIAADNNMQSNKASYYARNGIERRHRA